MEYTVTFADLQHQDTAVVRAAVRPSEIPGHLGAVFAETAAEAGSQGLSVVGPPFGRYTIDDDQMFHLEAGIPVSAPVVAAGRVEPSSLPQGRVARTMHVGDYAAVGAAYEAARDRILADGYACTEAPWESYLDEPDVAAPRTEVFVPCTPQRPAGDGQASTGRSL